MKIIRIIAVSLFVVMLAGAGAYADSARVVARGDGLEIFGADVALMKKTVGQSAQPSAEALVEGTVRMKLFAAEARKGGIECPAAADTSGFDQDIVLAGCYLEARLAALTLRDEAIESYFRAHWQRYVDKKDGELRDLDAELRKEISERILAAKKMNFGLQEYNRLCEEYNIVFTGNGS